MPQANLIDFLLDSFSRGSEVAQYISVYNNLRQTSNDDIMKELAHQNAEYLDTIVKQNREIIKLLGGKDNV